MIQGKWDYEWEQAPSAETTVFNRELPEGPLEPGRFALFVAWTCPFAHRTLLARALKGLSSCVPVYYTNLYGERSWHFEESMTSPYGDSHLDQVYLRACADYTGSVSVPVLWDNKEHSIVSNESADIVAMFDGVPSDAAPLRPKEHLGQIDEMNALVDELNRGIYGAAFAQGQADYDEGVHLVFETLNEFDKRLRGNDWLVGNTLTEADLRLFVATFRFDPAYYPIFHCNIRRLRDYPAVQSHLERFYELPGIAETCNVHDMRRGYASMTAFNPKGILPAGPLDLIGA